MKGIISRRPAESGTAAMAVAILAGKALGLDAETTAYLAIALGAAPGAITFMVEQYRRARGGSDLEQRYEALRRFRARVEGREE